MNATPGQIVLYPFQEEFYTDPDTYMGPDTDPMLDDNDEVVFMAKDTGNIASAITEPQGVIAGLRAEVQVSDPLDGTTGYVYLFQSAGELDPSANQRYVDYLGTFQLVGLNFESSTVSSKYYERGFSSRRVSRELRITAPGASGVDFGYLIQTTHLCAAPPTMNCGLRSTKEHSLPTREGPCVVSARTWVCKADQRPSGFKTNWTATRISRSPSCIKLIWRIRTLAINE